jgi:hypothetical protein
MQASCANNIPSTTNAARNDFRLEQRTSVRKIDIHACMLRVRGVPTCRFGKGPATFFFCECFINRITLYCYRSIQSNLLLLFFSGFAEGK